MWSTYPLGAHMGIDACLATHEANLATHETNLSVHETYPDTPEQETGYPDEQHYLLKLCLELQVEILLLALGSSAVASHPVEMTARATANHPGFPRSDEPDRPWSRWLAEDLELVAALARDCVNDGVPLPSSMGLPAGAETVGGAQSLGARYSALTAVVAEMLDRIDPTHHPVAAARLTQAYTRCDERLYELLGQRAANHVARRPAQVRTPSHYLG
jgi:hypothetical protein